MCVYIYTYVCIYIYVCVYTHIFKKPFPKTPPTMQTYFLDWCLSSFGKELLISKDEELFVCIYESFFSKLR